MIRKPALSRDRERGITLIELMIVVVIVAVLGAIAFPSYRQYSIRTQRTEAKSALLEIAANQERWYLEENTYSSNLANLGFPTTLSSDGNYQLSITAATTQAFTARAEPVAGGNLSDDDDCEWFEINSEGARTAESADCW